MRTMAPWWWCETQAPGSPPRRRIDFLRPFIQPRPTGWGLGSRSAGRSSKPMAGACGPRQTSLTGRSSSSACRRKASNQDDFTGRCPLVTEEQPVTFVIDDDAIVREAVADLLRSVGLSVKAFGSTQEFLHSKRPNAPGC